MNDNKYVEQGRESILSYSAAVLNDNEVQLMDFVTLEIKRNLTVFLHANRIYIRRAFCENALVPGETCHPHRYNGSLARSGDSALLHQYKKSMSICHALRASHFLRRKWKMCSRLYVLL